MKRVRVIVGGRVQGVFFRASLQRLAQSRRLAGWARNNADGTVETVFEGDEEAVQALLDFCRSGPRGARVDEIRVSDEEPEGLGGFVVR